MKTIFLIILLILLTGCVKTMSFRAKKYPLVKSELIKKSDAPSIIETPNATIEIRSKSFNGYIHVGLFIKPKFKTISYKINKTLIESLVKEVRYNASDLSSEFTFLCARYPWKDQYLDGSTNVLSITKSCPLKINYTFEINFKWSKIGSKMMSGFTFYDYGIDSVEPFKVKLMPAEIH